MMVTVCSRRQMEYGVGLGSIIWSGDHACLSTVCLKIAKMVTFKCSCHKNIKCWNDGYVVHESAPWVSVVWTGWACVSLPQSNTYRTCTIWHGFLPLGWHRGQAHLVDRSLPNVCFYPASHQGGGVQMRTRKQLSAFWVFGWWIKFTSRTTGTLGDVIKWNA